MGILPYVERLALKDPQSRRAAVFGILDELGYAAILHRERIEQHVPENIIVRLGRTTPRLVLGAHYDSVPGSTGANDNAASVAMLLRLLHHYRSHPPRLACDIVFFDLEETGNWGSRTYMRSYGAGQTLAMLNFDVCGVGDTLLIGPRRNVDWPLAAALEALQHQQLAPTRVVEQLPPGDEQSFDAVGIPNLAVTILPQADVGLLIQAVPALRAFRHPACMPVTAETIHNGPRDSIAAIEESALHAVLEWTKAFVAAVSDTLDS